MNSYHDYESLGFLDWKLRHPEIIEAFQGTSIVGWYGRIETQLVNMLNDAEKGRNFTYADKIREFLKIWRANEITGSINRETIEILKGASDILAVDQWNFSTYFRSLRDQLKVLIASEEQLPRGMEEPGNVPMAGGGGGAPPMSPTFGAEEGAPGDEGGAGGMAGGVPGGELGTESGAEGQTGEEKLPTDEEPKPGEEEAPGAEPGAPAPEENDEEPPNPDEMPGERLGLA